MQGNRKMENVVVVQINDYDWMIGESVESCVEEYKKSYSSDPDDYSDPWALDDQELDRLIFRDEYADTERTFREQVEVEVQSGGQFPRIFACAEQ